MPRFLHALKSLATRRLAAVKVADGAAPSSAHATASSLLRELASSLRGWVPRRAQRCFVRHFGDKSPSEWIFLASILLTVLLFVVIVPAFEALLDDSDGEEEDGEVVSAIPSPRASAGVVEADVSDMDEMPSIRSSSSGSSCGSCSLDMSLETIEESEEENLQDDDDDSFLGELLGEGSKEIRFASDWES